MTRAPLLHFVALGALLFATKLALPQPREVLHVPSADAADEEILVREALRLGLERSDAVVRSRLVRNMRFIGSGSAPQEEAALFEQALALGMARSDLPVRRRLVQAMHERFAAGIDVSEAQVRTYVEQHAERYAPQRRVSFRQVFLNADRHRQDLEAVAKTLAAQLADGATVKGDAFLQGSAFAGASEPDLARAFGAGFARQAMASPKGEWSGPIRSSYGLHFVHVTNVASARAPDYAAVRRAARYALLQEREAQAAGEALRELRGRYAIEVGRDAVALAKAP